MSNENQEMNISPKNVFGKCDLKCSYNFKYSESNITAKNDGTQISLTYDNSSVSPVSYNSQKYSVSKISLYSPSLHLFNNNKINAEFVVEHVPELGGKNLYVCVPIIQSSNSSTATDLLTEVIKKVSTNAPSAGDSTNLNISGFSLENIIPKKPFFSYTNTSALPGDYIVYGLFGSISLTEDTLNTLKSIIQPYSLSMMGGNLFLNPKGPNSLENEEDIYISCQPTGSSEEETQITNSKNDTTGIDFASLYKSPIFQIIIKIIMCTIVFILLYLIINYLYGYMIGEPVKFSQLTSMKMKSDR
jgi:hypothetical protein